MTRTRALFCGLPAFGHLYPMIPFALAARAAGREVGATALFLRSQSRAIWSTHTVTASRNAWFSPSAISTP